MKKLLVVATLIFVFAIGALADDHNGNQKKCPIMGGDIDKAVYTDYKDVRVFFCCPGCIAKFNETPEKHIAEMEKNGVELMKLAEQSVCPVSGMEIKSKDFFVDVMGKRVYTCCENCIAKVKEDPKKYMKVIAERGEYLQDAEESK